LIYRHDTTIGAGVVHGAGIRDQRMPAG